MDEVLLPSIALIDELEPPQIARMKYNYLWQHYGWVTSDSTMDEV